MIHLTLTMPATSTELSDYAALVADIDPELPVAHEADRLVAVIGRPGAEPIAEPEPTPAPSKPRRADKRAAKKAPAKRAPSGANNEAILDVLRNNGGTWTSSASDLGRAAGLDVSISAPTLRRLEDAGKVRVDRKGRRVLAVHLVDATRPDLRPVPTPPAVIEESKVAHPARPALPAPAQGVSAPAGGWK